MHHESPDTRQPTSALDRQARGVGGTQSIQRSIDVLRAIAGSADDRGVRILDLCKTMGLERPTMHRILSCLEHNGMIVRGADPRRYILGPTVMHLGLAATRHFDIRDVCAPSLMRLADQTGDTVFLTVRSGSEGITCARYEGHFPVKALTLGVGASRPLAVGAGGMSILATLPDAERERVLQASAERWPRFMDLSKEKLEELLDEAKHAGHVINRGHVMPEVTAIGMAIRNRSGVAIGAISVAAIVSRMSEIRIAQCVELMREETRRIELNLAIDYQ